MTLTLLALLLVPSAELPVEAPIVPGARSLEEPGRYRSARSWDETIDYYRRVFRRTGGVRWNNIVNQPGIKAKNIQSLRKKTNWEGINIYEMRGEVRLFVLTRPPPDKPAKKPAKK